MSTPAKVTDSASGLSLLPWQVGHGLPSMNRDTRFLISALWVLAKVCNTYRRAPVKVPMQLGSILRLSAVRVSAGVKPAYTGTVGVSSVNRIQSRSFFGRSFHGRSTS